MIDSASLNANELVSKLKSGDISSVDLCKAYIKRIEKFEKDVQAWAFLDKKILLEKAEEADEYRKSGKPLGALHGLPIAIKDLTDVIGFKTTYGFPGTKNNQPKKNSLFVSRLIDKGAIVIGKTNTAELGVGGHTINRLFGPTSNVYDLSLIHI